MWVVSEPVKRIRPPHRPRVAPCRCPPPRGSVASRPIRPSSTGRSARRCGPRGDRARPAGPGCGRAPSRRRGRPSAGRSPRRSSRTAGPRRAGSPAPSSRLRPRTGRLPRRSSGTWTRRSPREPPTDRPTRVSGSARSASILRPTSSEPQLEVVAIARRGHPRHARPFQATNTGPSGVGSTHIDRRGRPRRAPRADGSRAHWLAQRRLGDSPAGERGRHRMASRAGSRRAAARGRVRRDGDSLRPRGAARRSRSPRWTCALIVPSGLPSASAGLGDAQAGDMAEDDRGADRGVRLSKAAASSRCVSCSVRCGRWARCGRRRWVEARVEHRLQRRRAGFDRPAPVAREIDRDRREPRPKPKCGDPLARVSADRRTAERARPGRLPRRHGGRRGGGGRS